MVATTVTPLPPVAVGDSRLEPGCSFSATAFLLEDDTNSRLVWVHFSYPVDDALLFESTIFAGHVLNRVAIRAKTSYCVEVDDDFQTASLDVLKKLIQDELLTLVTHHVAHEVGDLETFHTLPSTYP